MNGVNRSSIDYSLGIQNQLENFHGHHPAESSKAKSASVKDDLAGFAMHNDPDFETREYKSLDAKLNKFTTPYLANGSKTFDRAMGGCIFGVRSSELKSVIKQVEKTQQHMTRANLEALEQKISNWIHCSRARKYERGGMAVDDLRRDVRTRKEDPLLGTAGRASYNSDLLNSVKHVHGEQVASFLTRVAPGLDTLELINIDTKDLLRQALDTPYMKSFKVAESMVEQEATQSLSAQLSQGDISRITEQVAKLPEPLISLIKDQSVSVVVTRGSISDRLLRTTSQNYGSEAKNANAYYTGKETGEMIVAMHQTKEGWMPPSSKKEGFTNPVLFHLGAALDNTVGRAVLGHPIRHDPEFVNAWKVDVGRFGKDRVGREATRSDDMGLRTAFSEGLSKAFNNNGNEHPMSTKKEWPAIQNYMTKILPKRLGVEFPG